MIAALVATTAVPLIPDGETAREWAERELADPVYEIAEPTPIDRFARGVAQFFERLFSGSLSESWGPWLAVAVVIVIVVLLVGALLLWGRPRSVARSRGVPELFGTREERSAIELRRAAAAYAARGEWDAAIIVRFRALARGLGERTIIDASPGTTVHAFARSATDAFPSLGDRLESSASAFDDVRYLRRRGTADLYRTVAETDEALVAARPLTHDAAVPV